MSINVPFSMGFPIGNFAIFQASTTYTAKRNEYEATKREFFVACSINQTSTIKELSKKKICNKSLELDFILDGETPLTIAIINGHDEVVKLLLSLGAKTDFKNSKKQTPLEVALKYSKTVIIPLLCKPDLGKELIQIKSVPKLQEMSNSVLAIILDYLVEMPDIKSEQPRKQVLKCNEVQVRALLEQQDSSGNSKGKQQEKSKPLKVR